MSWLAKSIANSLKLDDDNDDSNRATDRLNQSDKSPTKDDSDQHSPLSSTGTPRGVKEDISELTKTLTRQFWGVASFLAPPPEPSSPPSRQISGEPSDQIVAHQPSDPDAMNDALIEGMRSDLAEIGGKFKSGISKLSNNMAVSEITKIASNFLQFGSERDLADEDLIGGVVGVTEEVVAFARDVAMHPETWLDFPVPDYEDFDDFDLSDAQQEHALAVERLAPRLAALRIEFCPGYMSEGCFWKIYFVLLHPRLSKEDAELLSTPQILVARSMLSQELHNQANNKSAQNLAGTDTSEPKETAYLPQEKSPVTASHINSESAPLGTHSIEVVPPTVAATASCSKAIHSTVASELEKEKHPVQSGEIPIIDKAVVEEEPVNQTKHQPSSSSSSSRFLDDKFEDDGDDWLKEESSEMAGTSRTAVHLENDEDVSFSDLEEDDGDVPISYKKVTSGSDTSTKDSRDWVQLSRSSTDSVKDINPVSIKNDGSEQVSAHNSETKESNDWLDVDDIEVM